MNQLQLVECQIFFKASQVTFVYKSGVVADLGSYKSIAVLSSSGKVFERLIYDQLYRKTAKFSVLGLLLLRSFVCLSYVLIYAVI